MGHQQRLTSADLERSGIEKIATIIRDIEHHPRETKAGAVAPVPLTAHSSAATTRYVAAMCGRCDQGDEVSKAGRCQTLPSHGAAQVTTRIVPDEQPAPAERSAEDRKAGRLGGEEGSEESSSAKPGGPIATATQRRVRELEAELDEARAEANKAEGMLRQERDACEYMQQKISRLEQKAYGCIKPLQEGHNHCGSAHAPRSPDVNTLSEDSRRWEHGRSRSPGNDDGLAGAAEGTAKMLQQHNTGGHRPQPHQHWKESTYEPYAEPSREQSRSRAAITNQAVFRPDSEISALALRTSKAIPITKNAANDANISLSPLYDRTTTSTVSGNIALSTVVSECAKRERTLSRSAESLDNDIYRTDSRYDHQGRGAAAAAAAAAATAAAMGTLRSSRFCGTVAGERVYPPLSPPGDGVVFSAFRDPRTDGHYRHVPTARSNGLGPAATFIGRDAGYKEETRRNQTHRSRLKSAPLCTSPDKRSNPFGDVKCIEIPVGREDEGLLLGGGRVLHKLKEELGGTLEYRRSQGVVSVHGQQAGPARAASCVRTALLLRDESGEPKAERYSLARLCMDDLLAECIALKGLRQADINSGRVGHPWPDSLKPPDTSPATSTTSATSSVDGGSLDGSGYDPWNHVHGRSTPDPLVSVHGAAAVIATSASAGIGAGSVGSTGAPGPAASAAAAGAAAAAAVSVASNLPDGEYPPETASLRIIGEKFGCVIDVAGEIAADAAAAAIAAASEACDAGRIGVSGLLQPVGSATPVGHQDVLIWGPTGVVGEAKDAVAALVSGNACAEVVVGIGRIQRRDRGFWVNCETMASGMSLEVDHKRGSAWVRGRPQAVEEGRREFQNKLASLFPGDFLAVPMPRAALKDLANARGLAAAAAEANDDDGGADNRGDGDEANGVELWADWPCSCVRLRGEPAVVRRVAKALYAALAQWNTLEVSVRVDRAVVTRLLSRSGRILAGISSNMGITLLVEREKGVLRGRARTEDDAKEANRILRVKVAALSQRRSEQQQQHASAAAGTSAFASSSKPAATTAALAKGPILSPGLSSTHSERSGMSTGSSGGDDSPDDGDKELTDPFDELQAFFTGGAPPDGTVDGRNMGSSKRSCVFDGVEDVPSNAGSAPNGDASRGGGTHRNGGRGGQGSTISRGAPPGLSVGNGGRNRNGGSGSSGSAASAGTVARSSGRISYDHNHHQHLVHADRRSVIVHRPSMSPSGACAAISPRPLSSASSPSSSVILSDDSSGARRGGDGRHTFHPPPPHRSTALSLSPPQRQQHHHQHQYHLHYQQPQFRHHQGHSHHHHPKQPPPERGSATWFREEQLPRAHHQNSHHYHHSHQNHQQHLRQHSYPSYPTTASHSAHTSRDAGPWANGGGLGGRVGDDVRGTAGYDSYAGRRVGEELGYSTSSHLGISSGSGRHHGNGSRGGSGAFVGHAGTVVTLVGDDHDYGLAARCDRPLQPSEPPSSARHAMEPYLSERVAAWSNGGGHSW